MANNDSTEEKSPDVLDGAAIYRIRRDALMIVSNMNRGRSQPVSVEKMKRQMVFVQGQLCSAALADPSLSAEIKDHLLHFHRSTFVENIADRRGARRRGTPPSSL